MVLRAAIISVLENIDAWQVARDNTTSAVNALSEESEESDVDHVWIICGLLMIVVVSICIYLDHFERQHPRLGPRPSRF